MNIERIAQVTYEASRAYNEAAELDIIPSWSNAPEWRKKSTIDAVEGIIANPFMTPESLHGYWLAIRLADGWKYGPHVDEAAKTHPCVMMYADLPAEQKTKDILFINVVRALMPAPSDISTNMPLAVPAAEVNDPELEKIIADKAYDEITIEPTAEEKAS
jgi:hypothetical protein